MESRTCCTVPDPFSQSTFMIRSSASVSVPDCLGGTAFPPGIIRRWAAQKVTNSLVAWRGLRVARGGLALRRQLVLPGEDARRSIGVGSALRWSFTVVAVVGPLPTGLAGSRLE